ncbi:ArsR/SmtB family transcription factor [Bradyrhizobium sp. 2TAF24]|uniref:ArsR/SmtB family transcription factor n=1 Tax=Bradyrhizobium sp. 2TAF24 TaxID=3233011 RepID=UPI003F8ECA3C
MQPLSESLDSIFNAIANPVRRAILARLAEGETNVGILAEPFDMSGPAVSRHIRILRDAALVSSERRGKKRFWRLNRETLALAQEWLDLDRRF